MTEIQVEPARATWLPKCCDALRRRLVEEDSFIVWLPHVRALVLRHYSGPEGCLAFCPFCGARLPQPRIEQWIAGVGVQPDSLDARVQSEDLRTGKWWGTEEPESGEPVSSDWTHVDSDASGVAARCVNTVLDQLTDLKAQRRDKRPSLPLSRAGGGDVWFSTRDETTLAVEVAGTDWDGASMTLVVELTESGVRRATWTRADGGFVSPLESGQAYDMACVKISRRGASPTSGNT